MFESLQISDQECKCSTLDVATLPQIGSDCLVKYQWDLMAANWQSDLRIKVVSEAFGERIMIYLQLGDLGATEKHKYIIVPSPHKLPALPPSHCPIFFCINKPKPSLFLFAKPHFQMLLWLGTHIQPNPVNANKFPHKDLLVCLLYNNILHWKGGGGAVLEATAWNHLNRHL